ncbi:thioredoxin family protein [Xanthobacteraceae bacterium Astr-EGSB]|uniref:thioredoxin family protein n=1 Tax=Astrobacterium formosum TaxID=3069710 RepID=UPI0027B2D08D|nr:thioredoxin family protein [Xanthobacteraceae bacterium Astr-EGSB]
MDIKVLGPGCRNCRTLADLIEAKAGELGIAIMLERVTDLSVIAQYDVMRTPAVVIDGKQVHCGGVPSVKAIVGWLTAADVTASHRRQQ